MAVTKSNNTNITSPNGNSLAIFVDINDGKLKMKDINGVVQPLDDFVSVSGGTLQIEGGALINSTLQNVTDAENNVSQLQLATNATKINGNLEVASDLDVGGNTNIDGNTLILGTLEVDNTTKIKTANETYLDIEDGGGNNRFTIGKATGSQKVTLDYASNPTSGLDIVGSIRTYQDGTNLSDTMSFRRDGNIAIGNITPTSRLSIKGTGTTNSTNSLLLQNSVGTQLGYIDDSGQWQIGTGTNGGFKLDINGTARVQGQVTFGERVNIEADSLVTTQTSSVIASTTTNANMVIAPNGTGALVASIPDGTTTGGNARGQYAVDLKIGGRTASSQVASGNYSAVLGGNVATASGNFSIAGGSAFAVGVNSVALGGSSFANGSGSVAIGGEQGGGLGATAGGRASIAFGMGNQATADWSSSLGGFNNVASSQYSTISGGSSNTASTNTHATIVGGQGNTSSGAHSVSGGSGNIASGNRAVAFGLSNTASGLASLVAGDSNVANNLQSFAMGFASTASGSRSAAIGNGSNATQLASFAFGFFANANATYGVALGFRSNSYLLGQLSISGNSFAAANDMQQSSVVANREATLTTGATTVLSLDGTGTTNLIIPTGSNRMWKVKVEFIGTITTITGTATGLAVGNSVYGESNFGFKRVGGVSSMGAFIDDAQASDNAIMDTCSLAETAGASGELALTFTGPTFAGGGSVTMRVVAKVSLVEVAY